MELVDSVCDLKSSCYVYECIPMPNFEVLDSKIASALNRIIHSTRLEKEESVWRNTKTKKRTFSFVEDRSLT